MEEIFNEIRNGLDIPYMLVVNVVTYLIIKSIDSVNGDKAVPWLLKFATAILVGIAIGVGACYFGAEPKVIFYSLFMSTISWNIFKKVFKTLFPNIFNNIDYKK